MCLLLKEDYLVSITNQWGKSVGAYWASALNKFIDLYCTHDFTCINIDCLLLKLEKNHLRLIEYKHLNEPLHFQQEKALKLIANILSLPASSKLTNYKCEVWVFRGDEPLQTATVTNMLTGQTQCLSSYDEIKRWLEFRDEQAPNTHL